MWPGTQKTCIQIHTSTEKLRRTSSNWSYARWFLSQRLIGAWTVCSCVFMHAYRCICLLALIIFRESTGEIEQILAKLIFLCQQVNKTCWSILSIVQAWPNAARGNTRLHTNWVIRVHLHLIIHFNINHVPQIAWEE